MIPHHLTLKNFLSYENATLDFRGLHTACICGANGAGKSSLLEAISWSVWGESRGAEDDVVLGGAKEARVDFIFQMGERVYRIIRSRVRGQLTSLEFQIAATFNAEGMAESFKSLTERGVRATQEKILQHLKLDYETFSNSAYLRQGRADEFMLKRPTERKEILAELLKLNHYDTLAEQSKDCAKTFKNKAELLEQEIYSSQTQLQATQTIETELVDTEQKLHLLQQSQSSDQEVLQQLKNQLSLRQNWQQQLAWHRPQEEQFQKEIQRLEQEYVHTKVKEQELAALLTQESEIITAYTEGENLQRLEQIEDNKFNLHQELTEKRAFYQQQMAQALANLNGQFSAAQTQWDELLQQQEELQQTLQMAPEIEAGLAQLQAAKNRLAELDQLQTETSPLISRKNQLQMELERENTRLSVRLEEIHSSRYQLQLQQQLHPQLQQAVTEIGLQIEDLEKKRIYQQRVREKGLERRSFMQGLQAQQQQYEIRLADVQQKMELVKKYAAPNDEIEEAGIKELLLLKQPIEAEEISAPLCPLCDRPLDEHHRHLVLEKHELEQQEILNQLWLVREQLAASEKEIQILRNEYQDLNKELADYESLRERKGNLNAQLEATTSNRQQLEQLSQQKQQLEQTLATLSYSPEIQNELKQIQQQLESLKYDEKNHALARGQVDKWRWVEVKNAELKTASRRYAQLETKKPELQALINKISQDLQQQKTASEYSQKLQQLDQKLAEINYDRNAHTQLRAAIKKAQIWLGRYQELMAAKEQHPTFVARIQELLSRLNQQKQQQQKLAETITILQQNLNQNPDPSPQISTLEQQLSSRRIQLDQLLAHQGRLQQQQQDRINLQTKLQQKRRDLQTILKQQRIYNELAAAFGKNGIQALMIENVLPQLEAETNQILSRLSANQLHIQFITQKATKTKSKSAAKNTGKLIETLDILIADAHGTRPYETYSGGEAFRINFAIRLALARLLAHRSGTALQILIVDEGFGTQDNEGCERLIAAINAIASEFACILMVTHIPQFKEAFQARIEVTKSAQGSKIHLSV